MTHDEIEAIVDHAVARAARAATLQTLQTLGIDASDPFEMQRDMAHLRSWRLAVERLRDRSMLTVAAVLVAGLCGAVWYAMTSVAGKH